MKTATSSAARAETRFRQLCCLGLGGEAMMPALLETLHDLIPSYDNSFFWCDAQGELSNLYDENPAIVELVPLYLSEFHNQRGRMPVPPFTHEMRFAPEISRFERELLVSKRQFLASDFYNLIMRPAGIRDGLRLTVREGGRSLGGLSLWRSSGDAAFTTRDERRLAALAPYFAHALTRTDSSEAPLVEGENYGLVIADRHGKLLHLSRWGRALLFYATHPRVAPGGVKSQPAALPPRVVRLCRTLAEVFEGENPAMAPVLRHRNVWGDFSFRAYWLHNAGPIQDGNPAGLIGIMIQRREPLALKLLRRLQPLALSLRQTQLCLLIASGLPVSAIAGRMGVAESTVIQHRRQLYRKLDVQNRGELMSKLMAS